MIKTTFAKEYDQENDRMVYRNKITGLVQRPNHSREMRTYRTHCDTAPEGYESVPADRKQFALVLTTTSVQR